jgi:type IV pilus assembly protein PilB
MTDPTANSSLVTRHSSLDLASVRLDPAWAFKVPAALALRRLALPLCVVDGALAVAMADPADTATADAISAAAGLPVRPLPAPRDALRAELLRVYGDIRDAASAPSSTDPVAIVDRILRAAVLRQASDIHFNPGRDGLTVRLRVDGRIEDFTRLPPDLAAAVASRIKVLSRLDIAERRAPQDGAFVWTPPPTRAAPPPPPMDIRVATLPVRHGERLTLRLLESGRDRLTLPALGLSDPDIARFREILARPHGLVLLTGPTGSGKTTTLYAAIRALLDGPPLNILTVEDPVEYEIEGVSQAEVDATDKVSFAKALRSLLRHDPDVVMIGEIRDETSLDTAIKAALTGHLVLSTLHTNDAIGAVTRLRDMGLAPHLLAATLRLSMAQRLVRRLCPHCREPYTLTPTDAALLGRPSLAGSTAYRPRGCLACAGRGYTGRTGIFELALPDPALTSLIATGAPEPTLRSALHAPTLLDDAIRSLLSGTTSLPELLRTLGPAP